MLFVSSHKRTEVSSVTPETLLEIFSKLAVIFTFYASFCYFQLLAAVLFLIVFSFWLLFYFIFLSTCSTFS